MNTNYETTKCPRCNSDQHIILSDNNQAYGLVSITPDDKVQYSKILPVMPIVCKNCGHIELVHVNVKAIKNVE